ncbi:hypothetical protein [Pseudonocardia sp.]|uniref:hypothetical protein n=1 Tax=Pseudonocardia sp. TaxID=60912 RepID=UPI003D11AA2C
MNEQEYRAYADRVIDAAKRGVRGRCKEVGPLPRWRREDAPRRAVDLLIETKVGLTETDANVLREDVRRSLPDPREGWLLTTAFYVDSTLAQEEQDYIVAVTVQGEDEDEVDDGGVVPGDRELLKLTCGGVTLPYLLIPSKTWLNVHRRDEEPDLDHRKVIVLPGGLRNVSRKPLLQLRLVGGDLEMRPLGRLRGIKVLLDDHPLTERAVRRHGCLTFLEGGHRTDVTYDLTPWEDTLLTGTAGRLPGSPDHHTTVIDVMNTHGTLRITAPDVGARPKVRGFRVKAAQFKTGYMEVPARVHYTDGTSSGPGLDGQRWFIKIFRTPTPQHAAFLRETFNRQAEAIRKVIIAKGGDLDRPPWGIAPVHVIDPDDDGEPPPTAVGALPPEPGGRHYVFGAWFGAPGVVSDCFVVVASPWLKGRTVERDPGSPALFQLERFRAMAAALDECHVKKIAHCDLKPDNYLKRRGDYVLVDGDSVTEIESMPTWLPYTNGYATGRMLRENPPDRYDGPVLGSGRIIEHDRFGFGLLVLGALVGSARLRVLTRDGAPGSRTIDKLPELRAALSGRWPKDERWKGMVDVLLEPFDGSKVSSSGWTCTSWLDRVIAASNVPMAGPADKEKPRYDGPYAKAFARIRRKLGRRNVAIRAVDQAVQAQIDRVYKQSRWLWACGVGAFGTGLLLVTIWGLGWLP